MKERLINILCCPACRADLRLRVSQSADGEVRTGELACTSCARVYKITNSIPRFVETDKYVGNFSFEWLFYRKTQLDSHNKSADSLNEFTSKAGFSPAELKNKMILDVGCGTGRFMEIAGSEGGETVGVDLSYAVETAVENMKGRKKAHVVQADIFHLPFKTGSFDFIYSLGVLHHTPDTAGAFRCVAPLLRAGGDISIWVYSNESRFEKVRNAFTDLYRFFTSRMPLRLLWWLCHISIPLYYPKKLGKFGSLLEMVFPTSVSPRTEERVLDTFDWYSPKYQFKHTYAEVEGWFREAGLKTRRLGVSVAVTGSKP